MLEHKAWMFPATAAGAAGACAAGAGTVQALHSSLIPALLLSCLPILSNHVDSGKYAAWKTRLHL